MEKNVLELLENAAISYSKKIAVREKGKECSFEKLCEGAKRIGSYLAQKNVFGKTIPVFADKSIVTLQAFWGVTYAGGCYTLVNPQMPKDRINKIISLLKPKMVLVTNEYKDCLMEVEYTGEYFIIDELLSTEIDEGCLKQIRNCTVDMDPLYVNFTSGSTGIPKGVVVSHQSVIEFIHHFTELFEIKAEDVLGNQAPFDFDVSVKDIYSMLMTGATMFIIPKDYFAFPKKILDVLVEQEITTLTWAVSALCMITSLDGFSYKIPSSVNKVIFSGEVMPISHLKAWREALPNARFVNVYGPTEITCNCTYYEVTDSCILNNSLPIGKAFPNERIVLMNSEMEEVTECNKEGEICVMGRCLALGYYGDTERTKEVFVQNPLNGNYRELMYKTGDLGYWREDGNLMYTGRKDFQIKHLGHRIELNEIEIYIEQVEGVSRACCMYDEERKQIVAFVQGKVDKSQIRSPLRKKLIKYMLPERYVFLERFPMTANGKIDRKQLKKQYIEAE